MLFSICNYSEAAVPSFPNYCTESSLNFSTNSNATAYSEDDTEYATGRRNKTSRVNIVACLEHGRKCGQDAFVPIHTC